MHYRTPHASIDRERGAITIVVTLLLLVLLTITALGLSKNAFRQAIIAGTVRQAAVTQNAADAGLEWSIYWLAPDFTGNRPAATLGAINLKTTRDTLQYNGTWGTPTAVATTSDMTLYSDSLVTQSFDVTVTLMGQIPPGGTSIDPHRMSTTAPSGTDYNLWGVQTNGYLTYAGGGPTFVHRREAWFTSPPSPISTP